jgi:hypothetical protein
MEKTPFDLTPAQKGLLEALARETGKAIPALLDEALQGLQDQEQQRREHGTATEQATATRAAAPHDARPPIWEAFIEASLDIPDEELDRLPTDGATQHDHYIYGTPKRPV